MTGAEQARARYAALTGKDPSCWEIVTGVAVGTWYDFYDLATGRYGQCMMVAAGGWHQAPRGDAPTILAYRRGKQN